VKRLNALRGHMTFANVISVVALFIALGGASYAAINLPKNSVGTKQLKGKSVGTKQLKPQAVKSNKVKDRSLLAVDFKNGQLPSGAIGLAGPQGADGQPGATGLQGAIGVPGPEGITGPQGVTGPTGSQGAQGGKGDKGDQGDVGPTGPVGPTEGTATPFAETRQGRIESDEFETTLAGRLFVTKPVSLMRYTCFEGTTYRAWLEVDDVPVPGSLIRSLPNGVNQYGLTFSGVTADTLAPGVHTAAAVYKCDIGSGASGAIDPFSGVSAVVLGG
jgi:hypothetical protein